MEDKEGNRVLEGYGRRTAQRWYPNDYGSSPGYPLSSWTSGSGWGGTVFRNTRFSSVVTFLSNQTGNSKAGSRVLSEEPDGLM
jgi:hypothetical protein